MLMLCKSSKVSRLLRFGNAGTEKSRSKLLLSCSVVLLQDCVSVSVSSLASVPSTAVTGVTGLAWGICQFARAAVANSTDWGVWAPEILVARSPRPRCSRGGFLWTSSFGSQMSPSPMSSYSLSSVCLCPDVHFLEGHRCWWVRAHPHGLISPSLPLCRPRLARSRSEVLRAGVLTCILEGHSWSSGKVRINKWCSKTLGSVYSVSREFPLKFTLFFHYTNPWFSILWIILFFSFLLLFPSFSLMPSPPDVFICASSGTGGFLVSLSPNSLDSFLVTSVTFLSAAVSVESRGPPSLGGSDSGNHDGPLLCSRNARRAVGQVGVSGLVPHARWHWSLKFRGTLKNTYFADLTKKGYNFDWFIKITIGTTYSFCSRVTF